MERSFHRCTWNLTSTKHQCFSIYFFIALQCGISNIEHHHRYRRLVGGHIVQQGATPWIVQVSYLIINSLYIQCYTDVGSFWRRSTSKRRYLASVWWLWKVDFNFCGRWIKRIKYFVNQSDYCLALSVNTFLQVENGLWILNVLFSSRRSE